MWPVVVLAFSFGLVNGIMAGLFIACVVHFRSHPDCPAATKDDE
jgi:thiamine transporter ThiT